jgi:hypothetical protein
MSWLFLEDLKIWISTFLMCAGGFGGFYSFCNYLQALKMLTETLLKSPPL